MNKVQIILVVIAAALIALLAWAVIEHPWASLTLALCVQAAGMYWAWLTLTKAGEIGIKRIALAIAWPLPLFAGLFANAQ